MARRFRANQIETRREILYPHQMLNGKRVAVDLSHFPRSAKYLTAKRSILEKREYVMKSGRKWYEIWVPHNPETWVQPKVVFRDITEQPMFWLDFDGSVVNGDCYWLTYSKPEQMDLLWLIVGIGNSSFIEQFYDYHFNNKLYAGRRRFMTQYIEKFPLPDPRTQIAKQIVQTTKKIYDLLSSSSPIDHLEKNLDCLIENAFGVSVEKVSREQDL